VQPSFDIPHLRPPVIRFPALIKRYSNIFTGHLSPNSTSPPLSITAIPSIPSPSSSFLTLPGAVKLERSAICCGVQRGIYVRDDPIARSPSFNPSSISKPLVALRLGARVERPSADYRLPETVPSTPSPFDLDAAEGPRAHDEHRRDPSFSQSSAFLRLGHLHHIIIVVVLAISGHRLIVHA